VHGDDVGRQKPCAVDCLDTVGNRAVGALKVERGYRNCADIRRVSDAKYLTVGSCSANHLTVGDGSMRGN
jgi:hypothetical protein